jgi:hypothetical protein
MKDEDCAIEIEARNYSAKKKSISIQSRLPDPNIQRD